MAPTLTEFQMARGAAAVVRDFRLSDAEAVSELAHHLSRRAPSVPALSRPDSLGAITLVACDRETSVVVGVGWYTLRAPGLADVAFAVAYELRDEGIGG